MTSNGLSQSPATAPVLDQMQGCGFLCKSARPPPGAGMWLFSAFPICRSISGAQSKVQGGGRTGPRAAAQWRSQDGTLRAIAGVRGGSRRWGRRDWDWNCLPPPPTPAHLRGNGQSSRGSLGAKSAPSSSSNGSPPAQAARLPFWAIPLPLRLGCTLALLPLAKGTCRKPQPLGVSWKNRCPPSALPHLMLLLGNEGRAWGLVLPCPSGT